MLVFPWQKVGNELLKGVGKEGKVYVSESKGREDSKKLPGAFPRCCKKVTRDKDRNCAIRSGDELSAADPGVTQVEG